ARRMISARRRSSQGSPAQYGRELAFESRVITPRRAATPCPARQARVGADRHEAARHDRCSRSVVGLSQDREDNADNESRDFVIVNTATCLEAPNTSAFRSMDWIAILPRPEKFRAAPFSRRPGLVGPIAASFLLCLLATFALRPVAFALNLVDRPGGRKIHEGEVPIVGGLAMLIGLVFGLGFVPLPLSDAAVAPFMAACALLVTVGLIDDRFDLSPWLRLPVHCAAA